MDVARWTRLRQVFDGALDLADVERAAFVARECGDDLEMHAYVHELLRRDGAPDARLEPLSAAPEGSSIAQRLEVRFGRGVDPSVELDTETRRGEAAQDVDEAARYRVEGELARGGMGQILRVRDRELRRTLAMKRLIQPLARSADAHVAPEQQVARFLEEAQITAQLDHPGIVPVHDLGLDSRGQLFFTMKLVQGRDLAQVFELVFAREQGWSETRALGVLQKVCEAVAFAHQKGVVHRDLKPANVMVGSFGEVYVMDWGVARVLARPDAHDLRLKPPDGGAVLSTERAEERTAVPESPLLTREGTVVGTPSYIAPEQARGEVEHVGPRADVYAMGAMLYHLLARRPPFVVLGERPTNFALLARVLAGAPTPLRALRPDAPDELLAICEKAMARDPLQRYPDMLALSEDLRAFLEHRVVRAHRTGPWIELRKWVERNRALAAALAAGCLVLVAGLVTSLVLRAQSEENLALALANEATALAEKDRADREAGAATRKTGEVLRLSALQRLDDLVNEADRLWPAVPERLGEYDDWSRRARELVAELPEHERKLTELRTKALAWTEEELAKHRARHPKLADLERANRHLEHHAQLRAAIEATGPRRDPTPQEVGIELASLPTTPDALSGLAWEMIDPDRTDWGQEPKGLVLARRAAELAAGLSPQKRAGIRDTLAWALLAAGRFDEAMAEEELALAEAGEAQVEEFRRYLERMEKTIAEQLYPENESARAKHVAEIEQDLEKLEGEISTEWRFADANDKWWHEQLEKLVAGLRAFSHPASGLAGNGTSPEHGWSVAKRAEFARTIAERSTTGPEAARSWSEAMASIANATECPAYGGLRITPQLGLLPIGRDPQAKLWEFAHLATGEPAERGPDGKLLLEEETGLVFVLLPGGTFVMGAQRTDPEGPNYDPEADAVQGHLAPLREVKLAPFFLSKYEMTQGQWMRFTGRNPSRDNPWAYLAQWNKDWKPIDLQHPVEMVAWDDCTAVLVRLGLSLPREAQWEYGARAGTTTVWWCGDEKESLASAGNLADLYAKRNGAESWTVEDWDDGNTTHARVGSYRPNAFGLYDVIGNVWEWCEDPYRAGYQLRTRRGGGFLATAPLTRSAYRASDMPSHTDGGIGCRPARPLFVP